VKNRPCPSGHTRKRHLNDRIAQGIPQSDWAWQAVSASPVPWYNLPVLPSFRNLAAVFQLNLGKSSHVRIVDRTMLELEDVPGPPLGGGLPCLPKSDSVLTAAKQRGAGNCPKSISCRDASGQERHPEAQKVLTGKVSRLLTEGSRLFGQHPTGFGVRRHPASACRGWRRRCPSFLERAAEERLAAELKPR
jgi:hypothetical protein